MNDSELMADAVQDALNDHDLAAASTALSQISIYDVVGFLGRASPRRAAIVFRLLGKDRATKVFEALGTPLQGELLLALQDDEVAGIFGGLDPDDRVELLAFLRYSNSDVDLEFSGGLCQPGIVDVAVDVSVDGGQCGS